MLLNKPKGFEKQAFGAALQGLARPLLERAGVKSVGALGKYFKNIPAEVKGQAIGGGALFGGIEAATAEEGKRLEALKRGIGTGALLGAGFGVGSALTKTPGLTLRRKMLERMAAGQKGIAPTSRRELAEKTLDRGWLRNVKETVTGKGLLGRGASAAAAASGTGQTAVEWGLPMVAFPAAFGGVLYGDQPTPKPQKANLQQQMYAGHPYPQHYQPPKTAENILGTPPELIGGVAGGAGANLLARIPLQYMSRKYNIPSSVAGTVLTEAVPAAATVGGFLGGRRQSQRLFPSEEPAEMEKLKQIDFDKLMRYYKRTDATQEK